MDTIRNLAIAIVYDRIEDTRVKLSWASSFNPTICIPAYRSYYMTALVEIRELLESNTNESPISILEKFRDQMITSACMLKTRKEGRPFIAAYDAALNILDELL